jgi:hypothetical protein
MNGPKRTFDERLKAISGTLTVLIGLLALVPKFSKNISEAVDAFIKLPAIVWYLVPVLLLVVGMYALRDGLARRSRLLRPEALLLKADNPEHLKGREEDIDRLSGLCYEYQQVNLVGESGAGKSSMIQAGLCPRLKAGQGLFPIYLDVWGQDWEAGPRSALILARWEALSNEDRRTLECAEPPKPEHLVSMLEHIKAKLGRTPLLIFDQFDDYQTRHRSKFLAGRRRTWLPANRLVTANVFWRDIKEGIDNHIVYCLFATRTDTADGLESIRFTAPQVYRLDRLNVDFVLPLLTELTANVEGANAVVFAPDRGWERLKGRLARDLSQDGAVLPAQMKIALQGLASLRSLTVGEYERAGGVDGLQAAHVERHVASTAIHSGLTKMQVRTLLISLADPETLKTVPKSTADLEKVIITGYEANADQIERAVEAALDDLEMKEIIRKRLDPDSRQHVWILDHDYLCRGVLEAERRANRWFTLAQEGYRAFQDAGGSVWRAWRSLLSPWQQIVLATQRLRGRFRYETLQSYAAWSLVRFVPYLLVLAVAGFGWVEIAQRQRAEVDHAKAS